jgi:hypothetical protein
MNSFQTGRFTINYGSYLGETEEQSLVTNDTGAMSTIQWNLSEQNTIEFDMPFVYPYEFYSDETNEHRYFTITNSPIVPTMNGVGLSVFVYGIITLKNFKCFDSAIANSLRNSALPEARSRRGFDPTRDVARDLPDRDVEMEEVLMQSSDADPGSPDFSDARFATSRIFIVEPPGRTGFNNFWPVFFSAFMNWTGCLVSVPVENIDNQWTHVRVTESTYEIYPELSSFESNLLGLDNFISPASYDFSNMEFSYCNGYRTVRIV